MTENIKHEDNSELCEHPDMFEGKTADGVLWILSARRATSKIFDVMHKETRYKINHSEQPTWELPRGLLCSVQLMWIIINIANYKYCNKIYHLSVVKLARHFQLSVMIFKIAHPWLSWGRKVIWCNRLKKSEMLRICCNSTMTLVLRSHSKHICYTHSAVSS